MTKRRHTVQQFVKMLKVSIEEATDSVIRIYDFANRKKMLISIESND